MADVIKTSNELLIECLFNDGDTRTITLNRPRSDISAADIESLEDFIYTEKIIIGDREGSDFWKIKKAIKRETTTQYLDLEI